MSSLLATLYERLGERDVIVLSDLYFHATGKTGEPCEIGEVLVNKALGGAFDNSGPCERVLVLSEFKMIFKKYKFEHLVFIIIFIYSVFANLPTH